MNLAQLTELVADIPDYKHVLLRVMHPGGDYQDFEYGGWHSDRGDYSRVAFDPQPLVEGQDHLLVKTFQRLLAAIPGQEMEGWKGGTYVADPRKPVYLGAHGDWNNWLLTGVQTVGMIAYIIFTDLGDHY